MTHIAVVFRLSCLPKILHEFTHKERELFLRFVWGRSRLPLTSADFSQKFELLRFRGRHTSSVDEMLPLSHTCFFSVRSFVG